MERPTLSTRAAETAKPEKLPYRIHDEKVRGLHLRVQPSGVKSYCLNWQRNQTLTLGRYPVMTLDGARKAAIAKLAQTVEHGAPLAVVARAKPAKAHTFGEFITEHYGPHVEATAKAGTATHANIKACFGYLYGKHLTAISRAEFDKFKANRLKAGIHPATVNRDLARIKAALSVAVQWKMLAANPLLGVKRIKQGIEDRVRYLSKPEERALRTALDKREAQFSMRRQSGNAWRSERGRDVLASITGYCDHIMPMTLIALNTGLRRGEITQLTWADVNLPGKIVTVRAGYAKSGKARHLPLNSEAVDVLKRWKKQEPDGRLFKLICTTKAWGRLMEAAKLENFRFHDLRHTFASKLVMAGVDLNTVRELLGHGDIAMTMRYAHLAPEHKAAAVEMLVRRP